MALTFDGSTNTISGLVINSTNITDGSIVNADISASAAIASTKLSGVTSGITMADMWRMSASHTVATSSSRISSNWERVDTNSFAQIGTGMTESSGYFSFPQTGIYQVDWHAQLHNGTNNERYVVNQIYTTTNNSSYGEAVYGSAGMGTDSHRAQIDIRIIFDVTDISTHKFYIQEYSYNGNTSMYGGTAINYSYLTVIRLGDT